MKTAYDMISDKFIHCGPEKNRTLHNRW